MPSSFATKRRPVSASNTGCVITKRAPAAALRPSSSNSRSIFFRFGFATEPATIDGIAFSSALPSPVSPRFKSATIASNPYASISCDTITLPSAPGGILSPFSATTASIPIEAAPSRSDFSAKRLRSRHDMLSTTGIFRRSLIAAPKTSPDIFTLPSALSVRLIASTCPVSSESRRSSGAGLIPRGGETSSHSAGVAAFRLSRIEGNGFLRGCRVRMPASRLAAFGRFDLLIFAVVVSRRHRHQQRLHPAFALTAQHSQAFEEFAEVLVHPILAVHRRQKKVMQARHGEAQRRKSQLVGKRVPFGERQRPNRLVTG